MICESTDEEMMGLTWALFNFRVVQIVVKCTIVVCVFDKHMGQSLCLFFN